MTARTNPTFTLHIRAPLLGLLTSKPALILFLVSLICGLTQVTTGKTPHLKVHMLSGSMEYHSEASLQAWAVHLESEYAVSSTLTHAPDKAEVVANLEGLDEADVMIIFCRRWELSGEQATAIMDWIEAGKPILAIRTASHGFQFYLEFDHDVLGGDYSGHGPAGLPMQVVLPAAAADHPVLGGIRPWERTGKLYRNPNPAEDITVLLTSASEAENEPLAWVRTNGSQRVFTTAMGFPADFENPLFIQLLDNALFWVAERTP